MKDYRAALRQREARSLYRKRRIVESPQGVQLQCDGRVLLSFCSNDYLGLANNTEVNEAFVNGIRQWGSGAGAAHLISGHTRAHHRLENELAEWLERDRVLLFSTGYMANGGILNALTGRGDLVVMDRLNHASLIDGGLSSGAKLRRYVHADAHAAEMRLASGSYKQKLLATDGVFSMDGDIAPLKALKSVCRQHNALMMVDDAHGLGMIGDEGRGTLHLAGLGQDDVPVLMGTLGKAFGVFGAFVAGQEWLIETIIQNARSYLYTTASPAAMAEANRAALQIVIRDQWRRDHLQLLIQQFRDGARQLGLDLMPSETAIQPIVVGEPEKALAWSQALEKEGILVTAIRPPTVPEKRSRLRVTFSAQHQQSDVKRLLEALDKTRVE